MNLERSVDDGATVAEFFFFVSMEKDPENVSRSVIDIEAWPWVS